MIDPVSPEQVLLMLLAFVVFAVAFTATLDATWPVAACHAPCVERIMAEAQP